ncbi:hypothetical protein [Salmonella phage PHA46]
MIPFAKILTYGNIAPFRIMGLFLYYMMTDKHLVQVIIQVVNWGMVH